MSSTQLKTNTDVWIEDPRWSWYGTPLWKVEATLLTIRTLDWKTWKTIGPHTGLLSKGDFDSYMVGYHLYFTHEEYVMWKLEGYDDIADIDVKQGIVYLVNYL